MMPPGVGSAQQRNEGHSRRSASAQAAQINALPAGAVHNAQCWGSARRVNVPMRTMLPNALSNNLRGKFDISRGLVNTAGARPWLRLP